MLYSDLDHLEPLSRIPFLQQLLNELKDENLLVYQAGLSQTRPNGCAINHISLMTKPEDACLFEAHERYTDIHIICSGVEQIDVTPKSRLTQTQAYDAERDIAFYEGEAYRSFVLQAGDLLICEPEDAHRVAMMYEKIQSVEKIVIKVPQDLVRSI